MNSSENQVLFRVHFSDAFFGWKAPSEEDGAFLSTRYDIDDFLSEALPTLVGMAVCVVCADCEAGVEH